MSFEKTTGQGFISLEGEYKKLAYTPDFKELLRNPETGEKLRTAWNLINEFGKVGHAQGGRSTSKENRMKTRGGVTVEEVGFTLFGRTRSYRVMFDDHDLFVKVSQSNKQGGGHEEFIGTKEAAERIKKLPNVETINLSQIGYQSGQKRVYAAQWSDRYKHILNMDYYWGNVAMQSEKEELGKRIGEIKGALTGFFDVENYNMGYDPATKKIYLFDLAMEHE